MKKNNQNFSNLTETIEKSINMKMLEFSGNSLTIDVLKKIRDSVRQIVECTIANYQINLSKSAIILIANYFFKQIKINDITTINEHILINDYKISELSKQDLKLISNIFFDLEICDEINKELLRRNSS